MAPPSPVRRCERQTEEEAGSLTSLDVYLKRFSTVSQEMSGLPSVDMFQKV